MRLFSNLLIGNDLNVHSPSMCFNQTLAALIANTNPEVSPDDIVLTARTAHESFTPIPIHQIHRYTI